MRILALALFSLNLMAAPLEGEGFALQAPEQWEQAGCPGLARTPRGEHEGDAEGALRAGGPLRSCQGMISRAPRLTQEENGTDIPYDVAPARTRFNFSGGMVLEVIPLSDPGVQDFQKAYPDLVACAQGVKERLAKGAPKGLALKDWPLWNCPDSAPTIFAKPRRVETPWCTGLIFLTRYTQEEGSPVDNNSLTGTFQGLSRDGRYFIYADIPMTQASLPKEGKDLAERPLDEIRAYYRSVEQQLNAAPDESFCPSLGVLDSLLQSLRPLSR